MLELSLVQCTVTWDLSKYYVHNCVLCIFRTIIINPMYYSPSRLLGV